MKKAWHCDRVIGEVGVSYRWIRYDTEATAIFVYFITHAI